MFSGDPNGPASPVLEDMELRPGEFHQYSRVLGNPASGFVRVEKTAGEAPFLAYGVINDGGSPGERSGDGAYLAARE